MLQLQELGTNSNHHGWHSTEKENGAMLISRQCPGSCFTKNGRREQGRKCPLNEANRCNVKATFNREILEGAGVMVQRLRVLTALPE